METPESIAFMGTACLLMWGVAILFVLWLMVTTAPPDPETLQRSALLRAREREQYARAQLEEKAQQLERLRAQRERLERQQSKLHNLPIPATGPGIPDPTLPMPSDLQDPPPLQLAEIQDAGHQG